MTSFKVQSPAAPGSSMRVGPASAMSRSRSARIRQRIAWSSTLDETAACSDSKLRSDSILCSLRNAIVPTQLGSGGILAWGRDRDTPGH